MNERISIRQAWGRILALSGVRHVGWIMCLTKDGRHFRCKANTFNDLRAFVAKVNAKGSIDPYHWALDGADETPRALHTTPNDELLDSCAV